MSNWFEDHPTKSIVSHTITVAAITWAISYFVIDSRKVDNLETVIRTLQAKVDALETDNAALRGTNARYEDVLRNSPGTIQYYEDRMSTLAKSVAQVETTEAATKNPPVAS